MSSFSFQPEGNRLAWSFWAFKGWKKASPSFSRQPLAAVSSALAVEMCRVDGILAAVLTLVMFEAYLVGTSVPSNGDSEEHNWRGGRYDQSRLITMSVDGAVVGWLQRRQPRDKPLLGLSYAEYLMLFRRAPANLQLNMVPYHGRHSGASVDGAENTRTLESVQKRGRWKSANSVRHHEKSGRVNQTWSELAPLAQVHCELCNKLLPSGLLRGHASPTLPRRLRLL